MQSRSEPEQKALVKKRKRPARPASPRTRAPSAAEADAGQLPDPAATSAVPSGTLSRARGLGWLGIGLGFLEIVAPELLAGALGFRADKTTRRVLMACGVREIATGIGAVTQPQKAPWLWARVAGDVLDVALVGAAPALRGADPARAGGAVAGLVGIAACDLLTAAALSQEETDETPEVLARHGQTLLSSVTVGVTPERAYALWRDLKRIPEFMQRVQDVREADVKLSHWRAEGPAGITLAWNAELTEDTPGKLIAWCSRAGSELLHRGRVTFTPSPRGDGTEVHVKITYEPPGGPVGAAIARLVHPELQLRADLRRFKQLLELGEIVVSDATITGRDERAAQPPPPRGSRTGRST